MRTIALWFSFILIFTVPWELAVDLPGIGTISRVIGLALLACWLFTVVVSGQVRRPTPFHLVVFLFVLWNAASLFWSFDRSTTLERLTTYAQLFVLLFVLWDLLTTPAALTGGLQAYVLGGYVSAFSTFYSYYYAADFYGCAECPDRRFSAATFQPDDLAGILALGIPLAWYLAVFCYQQGKLGGWLRLVNYAYVPVASLAIALTGTRGALLASVPAFAFALATMTQLRLRTRIALGLALVVGLDALQEFIPLTSFQRLGTIGSEVAKGDLNGRVTIWRHGLAMFVQHPLIGVGSGAFRAAIGIGKVAHNVYLSILVELGVIGFLLFAMILTMALGKALRHTGWAKWFWLSLLAGWAIDAFSLTLEMRKPTWLVLGLVVLSASRAFGQKTAAVMDAPTSSRWPGVAPAGNPPPASGTLGYHRAAV
jgi:O-antigen ligase